MTEPDVENWQPSTALRFINRDGKRILQQQWVDIRFHKWDTEDEIVHMTWRDIPYIPDAEKGDPTVHP